MDANITALGRAPAEPPGAVADKVTVFREPSRAFEELVRELVVFLAQLAG